MTDSWSRCHRNPTHRWTEDVSKEEKEEVRKEEKPAICFRRIGGTLPILRRQGLEQFCPEPLMETTTTKKNLKRTSVSIVNFCIGNDNMDNIRIDLFFY